MFSQVKIAKFVALFKQEFKKINVILNMLEEIDPNFNFDALDKHIYGPLVTLDGSVDSDRTVNSLLMMNQCGIIPMNGDRFLVLLRDHNSVDVATACMFYIFKSMTCRLIREGSRQHLRITGDTLGEFIADTTHNNYDREKYVSKFNDLLKIVNDVEVYDLEDVDAKFIYNNLSMIQHSDDDDLSEILSDIFHSGPIRLRDHKGRATLDVPETCPANLIERLCINTGGAGRDRILGYSSSEVKTIKIMELLSVFVE